MTRFSQVILIAAVLLGCTSVVAGPEHSEGYSGEVLIDTKGSAVIVLVDTNKGGRDGMIDQWFTLEASGSIVPVSDHITSAQIVHTAGHLRVISHERRVIYDFVVAGQDQAWEVPGGFTRIRNEGYGLARNMSPTTVRIPKIRGDSVTAFNCEGCEIFYPDLGEAGGSGQTVCASGGRGATACSSASGTQNCTITCGSGYYACCNSNSYSATCKCYRN